MLEYALQAIAVIVMVCGVIVCGLLLLLSEGGIVAGFIAAFTAVTCVSSGAALLASDYLYPGSLVYVEIPELVWLVAPASLASVLLFDLLLNSMVSRPLRLRIQHELHFKLLEVLGRGFFIALMLVAASRLAPEAAGVTAGAALGAGLSSAFARYYIGLALTDSGSTETTLLLDEDARQGERGE